MFQFHSGSIQTLNSMQRTLEAHTRFNSTLVRFKRASPPPRRPGGMLVSIPLWFDSNLRLRTGQARLPRFQFHSGSIQTRPHGCLSLVFSWVSIPLWFDSN